MVKFVDKVMVWVIDVGCGLGILVLLVVKLGYWNVEVFDNDLEVVCVSEENVVMNDVVGVVMFFVGDLVLGLIGW